MRLRVLRTPTATTQGPAATDFEAVPRIGYDRRRGVPRALVFANSEFAELNLEVALQDSWARFWFEGKLLPLPADVQRELDLTRKELSKARQEARRAQQEAAQAQQQKNLAVQEADRERREKEKLLAQLRELGIEPRR